MHKLFATFLLLVTVTAARADLPPAFSDLTLDAATKQVEGTDKLVLIKFTAEWCMPCKAMDQTTWRDDKVVEWMKDHGVAIQVDVDKERDIAGRYQISAMPTMVMLKGGNEIARKTGYMDAAGTLKWMDDAAAGKLIGGPRVDKDSRDMGARYQTVRELATSGKPDEATEEYVWLWEHMLEYEPSMAGVRGSYMASDMANLAARHAPAKAAFTKLRDQADEALKAGNASTSGRDDWIVLNEIVGDEDRTLAWFDAVKNTPEAPAQFERSAFRIFDLLVTRDRLADIPLLYPSPLQTIRADYAMSADMAKMAPQLPDSLDEATKQSILEQTWTMFRERVAVLYAGYLTAGRDETAGEILKDARSLHDPPRLITGAVGYAMSKGQARPDMRALLDDADKSGADTMALREQLEAALSGK
ncbi:MAG: thioredoxin family protein [Phycisphaeraceae bacterium]|nr:thioredoxin family protein [Phycisphaeraceae bacterium]